MNSVVHTESHSSVCSLPKHCRNRPPRSWFVIRHRCHFVKRRLCLATQTTIELERIERTASARAPRRPVGNAALAEERHRWSGAARRGGRATTSAVLVRWADSASDLNKGFLDDSRVKPSEICCDWLEARLVAICSGGNSRLSYLLGCGGRSFFDQENRITGEISRPWRFFRFQVPDPFLFSFFVGLCCVSDNEG